MLGAFNEEISGLAQSFFMFTYFTDRDGKMQLEERSPKVRFRPAVAGRAGSCSTEEAHHMFVGETGIGRVIRRALEVMDEIGSSDPGAVRRGGAIDLQTVQKYMNFWFSSALDLFGSEISTNAATAFANGLKGRARRGEVRRSY